jgi:hypothetical protein
MKKAFLFSPFLFAIYPLLTMNLCNPGEIRVIETLRMLGITLLITGVDTLLRPQTFTPALQYNGTELPIEDNTFSAAVGRCVAPYTQPRTSSERVCARLPQEHPCQRPFFRNPV